MLLSQGQTMKQVCRMPEISEQTCFRWRREYGGLNKTQARKLQELEKENSRLKRLVVDLSLDKAILKEGLSRKGSARQGDVGPSSTCIVFCGYRSDAPAG